MVKKKREALWRRHIRGFVGLLLIVIGISVIFHTLKINQVSFFDGEHRFTIAVSANDVALLTLEPKMKRSVLVTVASDIRAQAPKGGEGEYQIGKVYQLGALDKKGGALLRDTLQFFVGVPVDGWIVVKTSNTKCQRADELFSFKCVDVLLKGTFLGEFDTNLTTIDLIGIFLKLREMRDVTEYKEIALLDHVAYDEQTLIDGSSSIRVKEASLDALAKEYFQDQDLLSERLGVSIANGTGIKGFGNAIARVLANGGVNIVSVSTANDTDGTKSLIEVTKQNKDSYTLGKIAHILGFKFEVRELLKEDIRINLGED